MAGFTATATTDIDAPPDVVWSTLTDPEAIKSFVFGATVETDWEPGSSIVGRVRTTAGPTRTKAR